MFPTKKKNDPWRHLYYCFVYSLTSSSFVLVMNELCTFHAHRTCFIMISYCPSFSFSLTFLKPKKKGLWPTSCACKLLLLCRLILSLIVSLTIEICIVCLIVNINGLAFFCFWQGWLQKIHVKSKINLEKIIYGDEMKFILRGRFGFLIRKSHLSRLCKCLHRLPCSAVVHKNYTFSEIKFHSSGQWKCFSRILMAKSRVG